MSTLHKTSRAFTLIELMVAVGLFAFVMTLAAGAYLVMLGVNRQAQNIATGVNNLSFALDTMVRDIRTGTAYGCSVSNCNGVDNFSFKDASGAHIVRYTLSGGKIQKSIDGGVAVDITDSSIAIAGTSKFYLIGEKTTAQSDYDQPNVTIVISGTIFSKPNQSFILETQATMRGTDL